MSAARTGTSGALPGPTPPPRPGRPPADALDDGLRRLLAAVRGDADADGVVAPSARRLAVALGWTTAAVHGRLATLVRLGALVPVGAGALAAAGTAGAARSEQGERPPAPRTPVHDAVHEGTGSPLLW